MSPSCSGWGCVRGSVPLCCSSSQTSVAVECFENCRRECQQLESLLGQCKVSPQNHRLGELGRELWRSCRLTSWPCSGRLTKSQLLGAMSRRALRPEVGVGIPVFAHSPCRAGKERGCEGKGGAQRELGGDNGEGSALVAVSRCPDGCSSCPPLRRSSARPYRQLQESKKRRSR